PNLDFGANPSDFINPAEDKSFLTSGKVKSSLHFNSIGFLKNSPGFEVLLYPGFDQYLLIKSGNGPPGCIFKILCITLCI
ncbi:MAG: hypothetical protein SPJ27_00120, partial [Candidatus Onthovivens sp.]|nr:hypothetical protein [Candidatus Onthovivens sp.]